MKVSKNMKEANEKAIVKSESIKQKFTSKINLKADFSDTLEITRTLFKDKISKTSIVESALSCASASCVKSDSMTCTQIASFIINNLNVKDCFHKRETNKSNDVLKATILRVRHHVVDTLKTHYKADKLYAYIKSSDSVQFTDKYRSFCKKYTLYKKRVSALIARVKIQYKAVTVKAKKTA